MTLTPKITTEDIRLALNGTQTGSTYYFWDQEILSESVLAQINLANYYMYNLLGKEIMNSTDEITSNSVKTSQLYYSCFRLLGVMSGGVIIDGVSWQAGIRVESSQMSNSYEQMINSYKDSAMQYFHNLQPIAFTGDWEVPNWKGTSCSFM